MITFNCFNHPPVLTLGATLGAGVIMSVYVRVVCADRSKIREQSRSVISSQLARDQTIACMTKLSG
jgi:hypothetical protein